MTSNHIVRSCRQLQRHDSQQSSPAAAAADTSVTERNSDVGRRQSELERIKKAKHNRGKVASTTEETFNCANFQYFAKRLARKNVSEHDLFCVEWDVQP